MHGRAGAGGLAEDPDRMTERMMGKVPVTFNILTMDSQTPVHWWAVDSHTRCDAGEGHFPPSTCSAHTTQAGAAIRKKRDPFVPQILVICSNKGLTRHDRMTHRPGLKSAGTVICPSCHQPSPGTGRGALCPECLPCQPFSTRIPSDSLWALPSPGSSGASGHLHLCVPSTNPEPGVTPARTQS